MKPIVIIESPLSAPDAAGRAANVEYAIRCVRDSLQRREAPFASHLLYSRGIAEAAVREGAIVICSRGVALGDSHNAAVEAGFASASARFGPLDDADPADRKLGMEAGFAFHRVADRQAVYVDRGISPGMKAGIREFVQRWHPFVPGPYDPRFCGFPLGPWLCGHDSMYHRDAEGMIEFRSLNGLDVSRFRDEVLEPILWEVWL